MTDNTDAKLLDLRSRIAALAEQISGLTEAKTKLELEVIDLAGGSLGPVATSDGAPAFILSCSSRFNADRARELFASKPELLAQISETVISASKAKRVLPPAAYEMCQVASDKITVKLATAKS